MFKTTGFVTNDIRDTKFIHYLIRVHSQTTKKKSKTEPCEQSYTNLKFVCHFLVDFSDLVTFWCLSPSPSKSETLKLTYRKKSNFSDRSEKYIIVVP